MTHQLEPLEARQLLATAVSVRGDDFLINGRPPHEGTALHGTLPNVRAVNATFDDANDATRWRWKYPDTGTWSPTRNVNEFVAQLPAWRAAGLRAATLSFQGGGPVDQQFGGYQQWNNTAFYSDGSLKEAYLNRMEKAIRGLDANGMVAIVNFFYLGQEHRLRDDAAVLRAADNATRWLVAEGFRNVIVDAVNESNYYFRSPHLEPNRVHELIRRIKNVSGGRLLVGTSFFGGVLPSNEVVQASDVIFLHGNEKEDWEIRRMINTMRSRTGKPLIFNEDSTRMANFRAASGLGVSWGYYDQGRNNYWDGFQSVPVRWSLNTTAKKSFAAEIKRLSPAVYVPPTGTPTTGVPTISRLLLVDAQRHRVIGELRPNQYVDTQVLGTSRFSVVAEVGSGTRSVRFGLDSNASYRVENIAPFAMGGDGGGQYYSVWMSHGWHTVSATPFGATGATGAAGSTTRVTFRIVTGYASAARPPAGGATTTSSSATSSSAGLFQSEVAIGPTDEVPHLTGVIHGPLAA